MQRLPTSPPIPIPGTNRTFNIPIMPPPPPPLPPMGTPAYWDALAKQSLFPERRNLQWEQGIADMYNRLSIRPLTKPPMPSIEPAWVQIQRVLSKPKVALTGTPGFTMTPQLLAQRDAMWAARASNQFTASPWMNPFGSPSPQMQQLLKTAQGQLTPPPVAPAFGRSAFGIPLQNVTAPPSFRGYALFK